MCLDEMISIGDYVRAWGPTEDIKLEGVVTYIDNYMELVIIDVDEEEDYAIDGKQITDNFGPIKGAKR